MAAPGNNSGSAGMVRPHVFVSFASQDAAQADALVEALERADIPCWIAHRNIEPATPYPAAITEAVTSSAAVVLVLTARANVSPHVLREVEMAFNARTPILVVRLADVVPSANLQYFLSTTQWFDAGAAFDEDDTARLQVRLKTLLAGGRVVDGEAGRTRRTRRRAAIAAAIAAGVLVAGWLLAARWRQTSSPPDTAAVQPAGRAPDEPARDERAAPLTGPPGRPASPAADPASEPARIRTKVNPLDGEAYVWVPPGSFTMGCSPGDPACAPDELPAHVVRIRRGFWLGRTEVTEAAYRKRAPAHAVARGNADGTLPATHATWAEAKAYCAAVGGRLPTEAEWEYAARAGTTSRDYDVPARAAWYGENSDERVHPVGTKAPNALGLYDVLGNVAEWVLDRYYNAYDENDDGGALEEPVAPNASAVIRGGSWLSDAGGIRLSWRGEMAPDAAEPFIGFRCALDSL